MDVESRCQPCWVLVEWATHKRGSWGSHSGWTAGAWRNRRRRTLPPPPQAPALRALLHKPRSSTGQSRQATSPTRANESTSTSTPTSTSTSASTIVHHHHRQHDTTISTSTVGTITQHTRPHPAGLTNDLVLYDSPHLSVYRHRIRKDCIRLHPTALHIGMNWGLPDQGCSTKRPLLDCA